MHSTISGRKGSLHLPHVEPFTHITALGLHNHLSSEEAEVQRGLATAQGHSLEEEEDQVCLQSSLSSCALEGLLL